MNREKQVDEIINSLEQLKPAEPAAYLYGRIIARINKAGEEYTPVKMVWLAAASFLLLVLLNLQVMRHTSTKPGEQAAVTDLAGAYQLLNTSPINYN